MKRIRNVQLCCRTYRTFYFGFWTSTIAVDFADYAEVFFQDFHCGTVLWGVR